MGGGKGVKKQTLVRVYEDCVRRGDFKFNNKLVKQLTGSDFANQFDATKIDRSEGLPTELREKDVFIVHLGKGMHQFVQGIALGYHALEPLPPDGVQFWQYKRGILDGTDMSEAGVLSLAFNQRIIQDFLYDDPTRQIYINVPRRTRGNKTNSFGYRIGTQQINVYDLQIEMDFIVEKREGEVALIEAKCTGKELPKDFAVCQLFLPYRRLQKLLASETQQIRVRNLFLVQYVRADGNNAIRIYEYTFADPLDMGSIQFTGNREYILREK